MRRLNFCLVIMLIFSLSDMSTSYADGIKPIPSLEKILDKAHSSLEGTKTAFQEIEYSIKKFYYQIQYQEQKLEILNEVKGHFEKAVSKAEEKYDKGEEDISQSDITKLRLGLAGALNDIYGAEADLQISRLSLSDILNSEYQPNAELAEPDISPLNFEFDEFGDWVRQNEAAPGISEKRTLLNKAFLKVIEAKKKMRLARKNRKMTRTLLVSEAANYDFGVGSSGDLFQALIIYTRVLNGYYESIYKFNLSLAKLDRDKNL